MEVVTTILAFILAFCASFYFIAAFICPYVRVKPIPKLRRVLLVTSHPDDETMFFGPTVLALASDPSVELFLLCLSKGDYRGLGKERKLELYQASRHLGLSEENITVLSHSKLRDDQSLRWKEEIIGEIILQMIHTQDIDTVLTFDRYGVSGHKNHISIYYAMFFLFSERRLPASCRVMTLRSVNLLRHYSSFLDVPISCIFASFAYICAPRDWIILWRAMRAHRSQFVWFRKLNMLFSRFTLINTFDEFVQKRD